MVRKNTKYRRRFPRFHMDATVHICMPMIDSKLHAVKVKDISKGGISVYYPHKLEEGELIEVQLTTRSESGAQSVYQMTALVRWTNGHTYGLQYLSVNSVEKEKNPKVAHISEHRRALRKTGS